MMVEEPALRHIAQASSLGARHSCILQAGAWGAACGASPHSRAHIRAACRGRPRPFLSPGPCPPTHLHRPLHPSHAHAMGARAPRRIPGALLALACVLLAASTVAGDTHGG